MGLFRKSVGGGHSRRTIPQLNPVYYEQLLDGIRTWGDDTLPNVAEGIANAVGNTALQIFDRVGDQAAARRFEAQFDSRRPGDLTAADRMIDFVLDYDPVFEETLSLLLARLMDVLSRPPAELDPR